MGLETLTSHRDKVKLKWWYKLASMPARRYPRQLFNQEWKVKSCRGRQKKPWNKCVGELIEGLGHDQGNDIKKGQCPFLLNVNEYVSTRESNEYVEEVNSKVKFRVVQNIW